MSNQSSSNEPEIESNEINNENEAQALHQAQARNESEQEQNLNEPMIEQDPLNNDQAQEVNENEAILGEDIPNEANLVNAARVLPGNWGEEILRFFYNIFPNYPAEINRGDNEEEEEDDDENEDDEEDELNDDEDDEEEEPTEDDYENAQMPESINYDTHLPTSHNYLGENFEEVNTSNMIHEQNDTVTLPLLVIPGNESNTRFRHITNEIQLLPGQMMPLYFYSPLQVNMIKKRMREKEPTIGFSLTSTFFRNLTENESQTFLNENEEMRLGILAQIVSCRDENTNDDGSGLGLNNGLILKVKGTQRFRILKVRKDITGIVLADVKILPDIVWDVNPLMKQCPKNSKVFYERYFNCGMYCPYNKAEFLNVSQPLPAWVFRKYDCGYTMSLIEKELSEWFKKKTPISSSSDDSLNDSEVNYREPLTFSNWLLNNFPFDDKMRIECLKLDCVNQRLLQMYKLLKSFTNINCNEI